MNKEATPYLAELIGTFGFVFIGGSAVVINQASDGGLGMLGVSLAHGLALVAFIYAFSHISGAHFNPAITIAMLVANKIERGPAIGYIIAQLAGAVLAAIFIEGIFGSTDPAVMHPSNLGIFAAILLEAILTFFLTIVIFGIVVDRRSHTSHAGIAIGLLFSAMIVVAYGVSGGAFNPARAFGPAFVSNEWSNHLVYWIGPIAGSVTGALVYQLGILKKA